MSELQPFYVSIQGVYKAEGKALALHKTKISDGTSCDLWTLPGGKMDKNETDLQTLKREFHEEVGFEITTEKITFGGYHFAGHFSDGTALLILTFVIEGPKIFKPQISQEHEEWKWMRYDTYLDTEFHKSRTKMKNILKYYQ